LQLFWKDEKKRREHRINAARNAEMDTIERSAFTSKDDEEKRVGVGGVEEGHSDRTDGMFSAYIRTDFLPSKYMCV
jgi:hypothetical protein